MTFDTHEIDSMLIRQLADGQFHSGQQLGEKFGLSRAAINNHIEKLAQLGLDIYRVTGRGYKLAAPIQLLDLDYFQSLLPERFRDHQVILKHVTESTNDDVKHCLAVAGSLSAGTAVLAEMQTKGRGRRGKQWFSPFASNLYLSLYWPLPQGLNSAIGLSIVLGLAVAETLIAAGIQDVSLKWPNDVYIQRKKVSGILVELEGQAQGEGHAIIGIGLNLALPSESPIDQPFTAISEHLDSLSDDKMVDAKTLDRNAWAAELYACCLTFLAEHDAHGLKPFIERWRELDHFYQQPVKLILGQHEQAGIALGIDELGAFLLQQGDEVKRYFGGEISVRDITN